MVPTDFKEKVDDFKLTGRNFHTEFDNNLVKVQILV